MDLIRIELEASNGQRLVIERHSQSNNWLEQITEIRRATEAAIGAFYSERIREP